MLNISSHDEAYDASRPRPRLRSCVTSLRAAVHSRSISPAAASVFITYLQLHSDSGSRHVSGARGGAGRSLDWEPVWGSSSTPSSKQGVSEQPVRGTGGFRPVEPVWDLEASPAPSDSGSRHVSGARG